MSSWTAPVGLLFVLVVVVVLAQSVLRPSFLVMAALLLSSLTGALTSWSLSESFPFSVNGLVNGLVVVGSAWVLLIHAGRVKLSWMEAIGPFLVFLAWMASRIAGAPSMVDAVRDTVQVAIPLSLYLVVRLSVERTPDVAARIRRGFLLFGVIPIAIIAIALGVGFVQFAAEGFVTPLGRRTLALFLLTIMALALSRWRLGMTQRARFSGAVFAVLSFVIILISLSRTAGAIGVGLMAVAVFPPKRMHRWAVAVAFAAALFVGAMQVPQFRARFFAVEAVGSSLSLDDLQTQGRAYVWPLVFAHALERPVAGHGTGASRGFVLALSGWEHPHNDYLRVFHDYGLVGLALFLYAWIGRLWRHGRRWIRFEEGGNREVAGYQMAAFLGTVIAVLSFVTDNSLMYTFVMGPVFTLMGLADAVAPPDEDPVPDAISAPRLTEQAVP